MLLYTYYYVLRDISLTTIIIIIIIIINTTTMIWHLFRTRGRAPPAPPPSLEGRGGEGMQDRLEMTGSEIQNMIL